MSDKYSFERKTRSNEHINFQIFKQDVERSSARWGLSYYRNVTTSWRTATGNAGKVIQQIFTGLRVTIFKVMKISKKEIIELYWKNTTRQLIFI